VRGSGEHIDMAYMPTMCNHCDRPRCAEGADGAVTKRADGIVLIDPVKAKGRRDLVDKCPYGAIQWNEAQQVPHIWIFDAHLLDAGWTEPRCQQACPSGALRALKASDALSYTLTFERAVRAQARKRPARLFRRAPGFPGKCPARRQCRHAARQRPTPGATVFSFV
jgi:Fe-S-cluster-containing dehydrogenase component